MEDTSAQFYAKTALRISRFRYIQRPPGSRNGIMVVILDMLSSSRDHGHDGGDAGRHLEIMVRMREMLVMISGSWSRWRGCWPSSRDYGQDAGDAGHDLGIMVMMQETLAVIPRLWSGCGKCWSSSQDHGHDVAHADHHREMTVMILGMLVITSGSRS